MATSKSFFLVDLWSCGVFGKVVKRLEKASRHVSSLQVNEEAASTLAELRYGIASTLNLDQKISLATTGPLLWDNKWEGVFRNAEDITSIDISAATEGTDGHQRINSNVEDRTQESTAVSNEQLEDYTTTFGSSHGPDATIQHSRKRRAATASAVAGEKVSAEALFYELVKGKNDPHYLVRPFIYGDAYSPEPNATQPYEIRVHPQVGLVCDMHSHFSNVEIIGLLAGKWDSELNCLYIQAAFPCVSSYKGSGHTDVEADPVAHCMLSEHICALGMQVVGWYHSHPQFRNDPSITDIENQKIYQLAMESSNPYVGLIVCSYDADLPTPAALHQWFTVVPYSPSPTSTASSAAPSSSSVAACDGKESNNSSSGSRTTNCNSSTEDSTSSSMMSSLLTRSSESVGSRRIRSNSIGSTAHSGSTVGRVSSSVRAGASVASVASLVYLPMRMEVTYLDMRVEGQDLNSAAYGLIVGDDAGQKARLIDLLLAMPTGEDDLELHLELRESESSILCVIDGEEAKPSAAKVGESSNSETCGRAAEDALSAGISGGSNHRGGAELVESVAPSVALSAPSQGAAAVLPASAPEGHIMPADGNADGSDAASSKYGSAGNEGSTGTEAQCMDAPANSAQTETITSEGNAREAVWSSSDAAQTDKEHELQAAAALQAATSTSDARQADSAPPLIKAEDTHIDDIDCPGPESTERGMGIGRRSGRTVKARAVFGDFVDPDDIDRKTLNEKIRPKKITQPTGDRPRKTAAVEKLAGPSSMIGSTGVGVGGGGKKRKKLNDENLQQVAGATLEKKKRGRLASKAPATVEKGAGLSNLETSSGRQNKSKSTVGGSAGGGGGDEEGDSQEHEEAGKSGTLSSKKLKPAKKDTILKKDPKSQKGPQPTVLTSLVLALRDETSRSAGLARQMLCSAAPQYLGVAVVVVTMGYYYSRAARRVDLLSKRWKALPSRLDKLRRSCAPWAAKMGILSTQVAQEMLSTVEPAAGKNHDSKNKEADDKSGCGSECVTFVGTSAPTCDNDPDFDYFTAEACGSTVDGAEAVAEAAVFGRPEHRSGYISHYTQQNHSADGPYSLLDLWVEFLATCWEESASMTSQRKRLIPNDAHKG